MKGVCFVFGVIARRNRANDASGGISWYTMSLYSFRKSATEGIEKAWLNIADVYDI